jgi:hypothetical protein
MDKLFGNMPRSEKGPLLLKGKTEIIKKNSDFFGLLPSEAKRLNSV